MLGCSMRPAVVASRMKRATYSGSRPISGGRILTATLRPSPKCSASQTEPMPPVPSLAMMRHFSKVLPTRLSSLAPIVVRSRFEVGPAQVLREFEGARRAELLVPLQGPEADLLQRRRRLRIRLRRGRHRTVEDAEVDLDDRVPGEGHAAG